MHKNVFENTKRFQQFVNPIVALMTMCNLLCLKMDVLWELWEHRLDSNGWAVNAPKRPKNVYANYFSAQLTTMNCIPCVVLLLTWGAIENE